MAPRHFFLLPILVRKSPNMAQTGDKTYCPTWAKSGSIVLPIQKFYCGPSRAQIENPDSRLKDTTWLGSKLVFRGLIGPRPQWNSCIGSTGWPILTLIGPCGLSPVWAMSADFFAGNYSFIIISRSVRSSPSWSVFYPRFGISDLSLPEP